MNLYPNPTSDYIYIDANGTNNFSIYNATGVLVRQEIITNNNKIDIRDLTPGLYYIKTDDDLTAKFIKK